MVVGYLILLGLVLGFLFLGFKGFSPGGLPLTRKKNLTGNAAKIVGALCLFIGLSVLVFSVVDLAITTGILGEPGDKKLAAKQVKPPIPDPPIGGEPVKPVKPSGKRLEGLIAYWPFEEADGPKILDCSGRGNHAVNHGGTIVAGVKGAAISLNGKGDCIDYGASTDFNFEAFAPFTISGWIKTNQKEGTILANRQKKSGWPAIRLNIRTVFLGVYLHGDQEDIPGAGIQGSSIINDDKWHHFALVRFPEELMRLHVDGEIAGADRNKWVTQAVTTDLRSIGSDPRWVNKMQGEEFLRQPWFQGCIDEFCIFNRALEHHEVKRLATLDVDALPESGKHAKTDKSK